MVVECRVAWCALEVMNLSEGLLNRRASQCSLPHDLRGQLQGVIAVRRVDIRSGAIPLNAFLPECFCLRPIVLGWRREACAVCGRACNLDEVFDRPRISPEER